MAKAILRANLVIMSKVWKAEKVLYRDYEYRLTDWETVSSERILCAGYPPTRRRGEQLDGPTEC